MGTLTFWKYSGAGNDFVALDNRDGRLNAGREKRAELVRRLCRRHLGVGTDGVLIVESSKTADFRMRYYNSDGSEAETCGNGARCIARFAHSLGAAGKKMRFETAAGVYEAEVFPETVRVSMNDAFGLEMNVALDKASLPADLVAQVPSLRSGGTVAFVNTGVPHVVIRADDLENAPVARLGRAVRTHPRFAPAGTNVNFVAVAGPDRLAVRTYERGVEDETLACGTGAIACAIVFSRLGLVSPPVRVATRGGAELIVCFEPVEGGARKVRLEGEARLVFRGEMTDFSIGD